MAVSMRDLDSAFQGAGQKAGLEIWRIESFRPVPVSKSLHGKFFTGDSYVILKTTALKSGAVRHDIHYWLGKDTSQDESGTAAIKTIELDAVLGGRAVQYREVQGHESDKFLSYFKPCIIPQEGGVASGFDHTEAEEHKTRLYVCRGKHVVQVKEVDFGRSSLNHDDIFIVDTTSKIFQFNGSNSSIQERAKALEVVQYIKDTYHDGKCEIAAIEDGKLMADAETGEFWGLFGGFAPLPRKTATVDVNDTGDVSTRLFGVVKGQHEPLDVESLKREQLDTYKCYLLDCGSEIFVWMGRNTSLDERKSASGAAEELLHTVHRPKTQVVRVMEGFETVMFRSKFNSWPQSTDVTVSEEGRGKVAALLKRQGVNVKGLLKATPEKEEPQSYIDCTGNLQVWRMDAEGKIPLTGSSMSKFFSGDCYIFQYTYPGELGDQYLVGTWFGEQSVEEDRNSATLQASKMVESLKFLPVQARICEGNESIQFFSIFQSFLVFKGGVSANYKMYIAEKELPDVTYSEDGLALFRVQGTGPENMQAIQVEAVASSLNSSHGYILHNGSSLFTWLGNLTTSEDQELVERLLDLIKPNVQPKPQKEGSESEQFWDMLGGKSEYPSQKVGRDVESDPHLFSCSFTNVMQVKEIYNFDQDDLMTEDIFILDCHSEIYVWVGQQANSKYRRDALTIGQKFLECDFLLEKLCGQAPIYIITEGSEPTFFTRFFTWDSTKSAMHGNSFQRKLAVVKNGGTPLLDKPKRRTPVSYGGRSAALPEISQRSRSVSFSPERVRVRGRSPAFNALAAAFENSNTRNMSTPPPIVKKLYPKSGSADSAKSVSRSSPITTLTSSFDKPAEDTSIPHLVKDAESKKAPINNITEAITIQEDVKEGEADDDEELVTYPYERLTKLSNNPVTDIDVTKRETYLSSKEFREKFKMAKAAFYKLPKWKQNKLKMALQLF
ncbi:villin-4-like [Daucus carota subsp. sativus]|uniref:villin-4-like n=1 Tax=Daucus carota subsp. sativus TaxID=79200 RepID=UPI003083B091